MTTVRKSARKRKETAPIIEISDDEGAISEEGEEFVLEPMDMGEIENMAVEPPASPWKQVQSTEKRSKNDAPLSPAVAND